MKTFNEFLKEAEVSGDSGGSSADLSSGINSGNVVRSNPQTLGKAKRKKPKGYAKAGLPEKGLPSNEDLKEANISKAVMRMSYRPQYGRLKITTDEKDRPEYKILVSLGYKPVEVNRSAGIPPHNVYVLGGKPDYDEVTENLSDTGWKFIKDVPDSEKDKGNWESIFTKKIDGTTYILQVRDVAGYKFLMDFTTK